MFLSFFCESFSLAIPRRVKIGAKEGGIAENPPVAKGDAPSLVLPKGGGAISGLGEKFALSAFSGSASFSYPLDLPKARGLDPELALRYESTLANGSFGAGWSLDIPEISRKTDKGLPQFDDSSHSDVFVLSGAEDLVPVGENQEVDGYTVQRFRPRVEGTYSRIEFWRRDNQIGGSCHWRVITRDNIVHVLGIDSNGRIADPSDATRVGKWLLQATIDDRGNAIVYSYLSETEGSLDSDNARVPAGRRVANRYLERIRYANLSPFIPEDEEPLGDQFRRLIDNDIVAEEDWGIQVFFDYGQHDRAELDEFGTGDWRPRADPFSNYRFGFEVRNRRLCDRILIHQRFAHETNDDGLIGYDGLVEGIELGYAESGVLSKLTSITRVGYRRTEENADVGNYVVRRWPSLEFGYTEAGESAFRKIPRDAAPNLPEGVDSSTYQFVDIDGVGISGVLSRRNDAWSFCRNFGGKFGVAEPLPMAPVGFDAPSGGRFLDLAGDAKLDYAHFSEGQAGFFERSEESEWQAFKPLKSPPAFDVDDPNLRFIDLDGDGLSDILVTEEDCLLWQRSEGEQGYSNPQRKLKLLDEESGPRCVFDEKRQTIFLADMSGDGLSDIVRIRSGEVCYWPNLGYGRFGAKVIMADAPVMDADGQFDSARIRLADVDGSGVSDIIYLGRGGAIYWPNLAGNGWGSEVEIPFSIVHQFANVSTTDFYGNGTTCLVWSSGSAGDMGREFCCIDLTGGIKPHLLHISRNNLGAETRLSYRSSTHFYLDDLKAGRPWITRLPFPVHVVDQVETIDHVSLNRFVSRYRYHHGFYDGREREFRGFGMVEQWDSADFENLGGDHDAGTNWSEASDVPPVLTKTWFHHGAWRLNASVEQAFKEEYWQGDRLSFDLPESVLPPGLIVDEEREACRAMRGRELRREVFSLDAVSGDSDDYARSLLPYEVFESNYSVRTIQRRDGRRHAVFSIHDREKVHAHYERLEIPDPRVTHELTLKVDEFGNVEQKLNIGYKRRLQGDDLQREERDEQGTSRIIYTQSAFTNPVDEERAWRTPLPAEEVTYEIAGAEWSLASWIDFGAAREKLENEAAGLPEHLYSETQDPRSALSKRRVEHLRTQYRRNDLRDLLPIGELQSRALKGETLKLAITPDMLDPFDGRADIEGEVLPALRERNAGYHERDAEGEFWISGGREFLSPIATGLPADAARELEFARKRFFLPHRFENTFGDSSTVTYDDPAMRPIETVDAVGNITTVHYDYRVLEPVHLTDPNQNHTKLAFDTLGMMCASAIMGKNPIEGQFGDNLEGLKVDLTPNELDSFISDPEGKSTPATGAKALLGNATSRFVYDVGRFARHQPSDSPDAWPEESLPIFAATLQRQFFSNSGIIPPQPKKGSKKEPVLNPGAKTAGGIEIDISYSDGFEREIQHKLLAPPLRDSQTGELADENSWLGSGWRVYNNKGKAVREYQPFFSESPSFEFNEAGVSPILFYDPMDRAVATLHPDGSWEKVVFHPWRKDDWDANDTFLSDPREDPDVGGYFSKLDDDEIPELEITDDIRLKTELHAGTPTLHHFDTLGREFLSVAHNRFMRGGSIVEEFPRTRTRFDIEGDRLEVHDALERRVMLWTYDLLGRTLFEDSMDAGRRWHLPDAADEPLRRWDDRGHRFRFSYDPLHRPKDSFVFQPEQNSATGDPEKDPENGEILWKEYLFDRLIYGEDRDLTLDDTELPSSDLNLREQIWRHQDTAGQIENFRYDVQGNAELTERKLAANYRVTPDWADPMWEDPVSFDARAPRRTLSEFDVFGREVRNVTGEGDDFENYHLVETRYDVRGQLVAKRVTLDPPGLGFKQYDILQDIDYNERGDSNRIQYGNAADHRVVTSYRYDPRNFRLRQIKTTRVGSSALQDLRYDYDPIGNICKVSDAVDQSVYFDNATELPSADQTYIYDALYRLVQARGREHEGQNLPAGIWDRHRSGTTRISDCRFTPFAHPSDGQAMREYWENYRYDVVGNIEELQHLAGTPGSWTRRYRYESVPGLREKLNNRIFSTAIGQTTTRYQHDTHGNLQTLPHLARMEYDFRDQMRFSERGVAACTQEQPKSEGEKAYYVYDATGERVRKVTEKGNGKRIERGYFEAAEKMIRYDRNGDQEFELDTLHVSTGEQRLAVIETKRRSIPGSHYHIVRGQLSDQLGSASVEFDFHNQNRAKVLTYEEFHPFGTTAFSSMRSQNFARKRYRYCGKERDEETGLNYHSARYYAPWLGRWTSADPSGIGDGPNRYSYSRCNPVSAKDEDGRFANFIAQAGIGALIGGGLELGLQVLSGEKINLKEIAKSAAVGAVGGVTGGIVGQLASKVGKIKKLARLGKTAKVAGATVKVSSVAATENVASTVTENVLNSKSTGDGLLKSGGIGFAAAIGAPKLARGLKKLIKKIPLAKEATSSGKKFLGGVSKKLKSFLSKAKSSETTVDDLIKTSKAGRRTKGRTKQYEREGGFEQANKDFDALNPQEIRDLPNGGRAGVLPDGSEVNVRRGSSEGRSTLEIKTGKKRTKFRFDE